MRTPKSFFIAVTLIAFLPFAARADVAETLAANPGADIIRVTFINPGISDPDDPTGGFWTSVTAFMQAAARQLNIDLEVIYSERDHIRMQRQAREVAARPVLPDYLIVVNEKQAADEMIKAAESSGLKVFVICNTLSEDQMKQMGGPREKYPHWIGSLIPDSEYAGYQIAKRIIERAMPAGVAKDGRLHLFAISGDLATQTALLRLDGMRQAVSEYPKVELQQVFNGEWRRDIAYRQTKIALARYPRTSAIWAANDPIAIGAIEGAMAAGRRPGRDIFIGGLNWDAPALAKIQNGTLQVSVGGHFMTGGWALILLYDYHHGRDFIEEGAQLQRPIFGVLDRSNIDLFLARFGDRNWNKVEFARWSKVLNPQLKAYNFSAESVIHQP
jgi:ABC-type sugar transport system substrate-binding protein